MISERGFKTMKRLAVVSVATIALTTTAFAGDWAGIYLGADVGADWAQASGSWIPMDNLDKPDTGYFGEYPIGGGSVGTGILAGGHIGYDYQIVSAVVGLEGDWTWTDADSKWTQPWDNTVVGIRPDATTTLATKVDSLATIRARAGYLVLPSTLLYATGGVAFGDIDQSATAQNEPTDPTRYIASYSQSKWDVGYVFGGGIEQKLFSGWSVRAEYLYYGFKTASSVITGDNTGNFCAGCANPSFPSNFNHGNTDVQAARIGVSYRFGGAQ
jgi:outer membrane immunogenic protein